MPIKPAYAAINIHLCVYNGAVYVTSGAAYPALDALHRG
jgi:hypothetical protein